MDRIDKHILSILQRDSRQSAAQIAEKVGLSPSPCARRIKRLEESGVISGYHAKLDTGHIGVGMTVFVEVSLNNHQASSITSFEQDVIEMEEVVSCHVVSGAYDYLLEVAARDLSGYEAFTRKLQTLNHVKDIHTHLSIRQVKASSEWPIYR